MRNLRRALLICGASAFAASFLLGSVFSLKSRRRLPGVEADALEQIASLLARDRSAEAAERLRAYVAVRRDISARIQLAQALSRTGKWDVAASMLEDIAGDFPKAGGDYFKDLAIAHFMAAQGDADSASRVRHLSRAKNYGEKALGMGAEFDPRLRASLGL